MPYVVVCPLSAVAATVNSSRASHLISVINDETAVPRPASIPPENHLKLGINDITAPMDGMILADEDHVRHLIDFVSAWDRNHAMVVHCYAGISRSTAAAFIAMCVTRPDRDERAIALRLRQASAFAKPNTRLVALADRLLGRDGRMIAAIEAIGPGALAVEGVPFVLPIEDD